MNNFNWNYPTTIWIGENRIKDLNLACINLGIKKPAYSGFFYLDKNIY